MNEFSKPWPIINPDDKRMAVTQEELAVSQPGQIIASTCNLLALPDENAGLSAQGLHGENLVILEEKRNWSRIQLHRNNYIGWVKSEQILKGKNQPTHRVCVPRTFIYTEPDMKRPQCGCLSMGSSIQVVEQVKTRGTLYHLLNTGQAIIADHVKMIDDLESDYVQVAQSLLRTPYLWGGDTAFGIDCSGLVSLAMLMAGKHVLRDSDMQAASIGKPIETGESWQNLKRGDLVFWRGHVAIAQGYIDGVQHIIHANGHSMDVTSEPVMEAIDRIAHLYEMPIGARRPD